MKKSFLLLTIPLLTNCATIVKSPQQTIQLTGGLEDGSTKISIPTGSFTLAGGSTSVTTPRVKNDIALEVTCNGTTQKTVIPTKFDMGWGGLGNLVFGGLIGWFIDGVGDKAYDAQTPFNVGPYCTKEVTPAAQKKG